MLLGDARRLQQLKEAARHRLAAPRLFGTVCLGVVEEVASGSLPSALARFTKLNPGVCARQGADLGSPGDQRHHPRVQVGSRRIDAPTDYGPHKTLHNAMRSPSNLVEKGKSLIDVIS